MALRDLFARSKPTQPPTHPRGESGRAHYDGFIQLEELNADLQGRNGLAVFDRMYRTDPDVRRVVSMVCNPVIQGTWDVQPYGDDDATDQDRQIADAVKWMLFENLNGGLGLDFHFSEALPVLVRSGFCPFEQLWSPADYQGRTLLAPRKLALRLPRTIWRWPQDQDGELTEIHQLLPTRGNVVIPADALVYYRVGVEGDNWEGVSLLRPAYKPWKLKDELERLDAVAAERESMGVVVVWPPDGRDSDDPMIVSVEQAASQLGTGERPWIRMPGPKSTTQQAGWDIEIMGQGSGKGGRDLSTSLNYHSDKIASAFIAEFMRLAQSGSSGARALGETQQEPFELAVEALAGVPAKQLNATVIPRFVQLNFPDAQGCPKLHLAKSDPTTLAELGTFVQQLTEAQVLHPDDDLEDQLRDRADMPAADPVARRERQALEKKQQDMALQSQQKALDAPVPDPNAKPPPGAKPKPADPKTASREPESGHHTFARQTRDLRHWEQLMSLDEIEGSIDGARAQFEQAVGGHVRSLAGQVAQQVSAGQDPDPTPPDALVEAIHGELLSLYGSGRRTVADELARQRPTSTSFACTFATGQPPDNLLARAHAAAAAILGRLVAAARRLFVTGRHSPAEVQHAAEREGSAALRAEAQTNAAPALNQGRADEAAVHSDEIAGARYTSILDGNRCDPCAQADDDVLRPLDDPILQAETPPNPLCQGGDRCRCMLFYQLNDEAAPSA